MAHSAVTNPKTLYLLAVAAVDVTALLATTMVIAICLA
jgi:hypothetical protein